MNAPIQPIAEHKIQQIAGTAFSLISKLKMGGTGSMKMIHIDGLSFIDKFEATSKSQYHLSFELRPNALIGRTNGHSVKTFVIKKEAISAINFETFNLKIVTRNGIVTRHEAIVSLAVESEIVRLYVTRSAYQPVKKFFKKDWLNEKLNHTVSSSVPKVKHNALLGDMISRLIG